MMRETESESPPGEAWTISLISREGKGPSRDSQPVNRIAHASSAETLRNDIAVSIEDFRAGLKLPEPVPSRMQLNRENSKRAKAGDVTCGNQR